MKKTIVLTAVFGLAAIAFALASHHGHGRGVIAASETSRGLLSFEIHKVGDNVRGRVEFTERNRERVLHVVRMPNARGANFERDSVVFGGPGMLDNHPVRVEVRAVDGHAANRHDGFAITCKNQGGEVVFAARGELREGDVVIRHER